MRVLRVHTVQDEPTLCPACLHVSRIALRFLVLQADGVKQVGSLDRCVECAPTDPA